MGDINYVEKFVEDEKFIDLEKLEKMSKSSVFNHDCNFYLCK